MFMELSPLDAPPFSQALRDQVPPPCFMDKVPCHQKKKQVAFLMSPPCRGQTLGFKPRACDILKSTLCNLQIPSTQ